MNRLVRMAGGASLNALAGNKAKLSKLNQFGETEWLVMLKPLEGWKGQVPGGKIITKVGSHG